MTYTIRVSQFWTLLGLIVVAIAISNLEDAITKTGRSVGAVCTANQRPNAGP